MTITQYALVAGLFVVACGVSHYLGWRHGVSYGAKGMTKFIVEACARHFKEDPLKLAKILAKETKNA